MILEILISYKIQNTRKTEMFNYILKMLNKMTIYIDSQLFKS